MYQNGPRLIRAIPGRLRCVVVGLKQNHALAVKVSKRMYQYSGIQRVECSVITGNVVIEYNTDRISSQEILLYLQEFAESRINKPSVSSNKLCEQETAATSECRISSYEQSDAKLAPFRMQPEVWCNVAVRKVPIPLLLSVSGLCFLAVKQALAGRTVLATNPTVFYLSGAISAISGYSFLNRGFKRLCKHNRLNSDLVLGTSVLVFGLLRENLVVLASLSLVQYLNWQQTKMDQAAGHETYVSKDIQQYIEKTSSLGFILAGVSWALTSNPLVGLAVLLAANPRPALLATEFAWNKAELEAKKMNYILPENSTLAQLTCTKAVVFEDTSLIFQGETEEEFTQGFQKTVYMAKQNNWNIGVLNNSLGIPVEQLNQLDIDTSFMLKQDRNVRRKLEHLENREVLLIRSRHVQWRIDRQLAGKTPAITIDQVDEFNLTASYAKRINQLVYEHVAVTKIWNIIGGAIVVPLSLSGVYIANIMADSISLLLISRTKKLSTIVSS